MKTHRILLAMILVLAAVLPVRAQLVNGRFVTSLYTWEQHDTVGSSSNIVRAFQTAQFSIAKGDLSLHTYLQGALNATSDFGDLGRVRVYNLYLRWANIGDAVDVNLGRQSVYAGVGAGTIDGGVVKARLFDRKVALTAFGGATVPISYTKLEDNWGDNYLWGGQVATTALPYTRLGLSYVNRKEERDPYQAIRARDSTYTPYVYTVEVESKAEERIGADASFNFEERVSVYARYDYDLDFERPSRFITAARFGVTRELAFTADYFYRKPRVSWNSIFGAFVANTIHEIEGGVEYEVFYRFRAFAKVARVIYEDDESNRWTIGLNSGYGSVSYSGSNGYAGELAAFTLEGAYPLANRTIIPNAAVHYQSYRLDPGEDRQDALSFVLGATFRPVQTFAVDLQGQLLSNKYYKNDVRLNARLTYWFAEQLSIF